MNNCSFSHQPAPLWPDTSFRILNWCCHRVCISVLITYLGIFKSQLQAINNASSGFSISVASEKISWRLGPIQQYPSLAYICRQKKNRGTQLLVKSRRSIFWRELRICISECESGSRRKHWKSDATFSREDIEGFPPSIFSLSVVDILHDIS
jgi:hypothetical protein